MDQFDMSVFAGKKVLVFGGSGFIGSNFIRTLLNGNAEVKVANMDALTYSGNPNNLKDIEGDPVLRERYRFMWGNIQQAEDVNQAFKAFEPDYVINFAAETHVDRSIHVGSKEFIDTNITGVFNILEAVKANPSVIKYLQVSTDEVYGMLDNPYDILKESRECNGVGCVDKLQGTHYHMKGGDVAVTREQLFDYVHEIKFHPDSQFKPNVPYSATKAGGDCLCNAYYHTWKLPVVVTHCTNNYGPYQYPEKLVPFWIMRLESGQKIPMYGDGLNMRDWIHVDDHVRGLFMALVNGVPGMTYNFGADNEKTNIDMSLTIWDIMCERQGLDPMVAQLPLKVHPMDGAGIVPEIPSTEVMTRNNFTETVKDRPGHDRRYAIDITHVYESLGWEPMYGADKFREKLAETVAWYQDHCEWVDEVITRTGVANPHIDLWRAHKDLENKNG